MASAVVETTPQNDFPMFAIRVALKNVYCIFCVGAGSLDSR
jgi:hypothetical protein